MGFTQHYQLLKEKRKATWSQMPLYIPLCELSLPCQEWWQTLLDIYIPREGRQFTPLHSWKEFWGSSTYSWGFLSVGFSSTLGCWDALFHWKDAWSYNRYVSKVDSVINGIRENKPLLVYCKECFLHYTDFLFSFISVKLSCIHSPSTKREKGLSNTEMSEWARLSWKVPTILWRVT